MNNDESEPLKNLYMFLGNNQPLAKKNAIIFGLENYGLNIDEEDFQRLKHDIERKSKNGDITFDDFKSCWEESKTKETYETKDLNIKLFNLLIELSQTDNKNANKLMKSELDSKGIAHVLKFLDCDIHECLNNYVMKDDEFLKANKKYKNTLESTKMQTIKEKELTPLHYEMVAQYLISSIDENVNNVITLKEFENLVEDYKQEKNIN